MHNSSMIFELILLNYLLYLSQRKIKFFAVSSIDLFNKTYHKSLVVSPQAFIFLILSFKKIKLLCIVMFGNMASVIKRS